MSPHKATDKSTFPPQAKLQYPPPQSTHPKATLIPSPHKKIYTYDSESPIASNSFANAQILHPSPILSLNNRAVVTFGPTVRDALIDTSSSVCPGAGENGRGVCTAERVYGVLVDEGFSDVAWMCERWKMCPQAKPTRISFSVDYK